MAPAPDFACVWDAGPRVRPRVVRAVASRGGGGRLVRSIRTRARPQLFFSAETSLVIVPIVVRDRRGRFVEGLARDDFAILEDGVPQEIQFFEAVDVPLDLVFAIDFSSSMAPVADRLKRAAGRFVRALAGRGSLSVIAFNDQVFVLGRRERSPEALLAAIDALPAPTGGTAMLDAVARALTLHGEDLAHQVVVLFTDGDDQHSLSSLRGVQDRIRASQATVYVVTLGRGRRIERVRALLDRLTRLSGGRSFPVDRIDDLEPALDYVRNDLRDRYFIGYRPSNAELDGTWRRIEVRTPDRRHVIRAPRGLSRRAVARLRAYRLAGSADGRRRFRPVLQSPVPGGRTRSRIASRWLTPLRLRRRPDGHRHELAHARPAAARRRVAGERDGGAHLEQGGGRAPGGRRRDGRRSTAARATWPAARPAAPARRPAGGAGSRDRRASGRARSGRRAGPSRPPAPGGCPSTSRSTVAPPAVSPRAARKRFQRDGSGENMFHC